MSRGSRIIYVGNLPGDIREREVEDLFYKYGRIIYIDLKIPPRPPGYAFVEFESPRDADDAIRGRDGYNFDGHRLRVELAHGGRGHSSSYDRRSSYKGGGGGVSGGGGGGGGSRGVSRRSDYRVFVTGLPSSASWQDLKDHMRQAGDVCFSEVFRDGSGTTGIVDYTNYDDMKYAIKKLDDSEFRNAFSRAYVRVKEYDEKRSRSHSLSRSRSRSRSHSKSRSASRSPKNGGSRSKRSQSRSKSPSRSPAARRKQSKSPRSVSRSRSLSRSRSPVVQSDRSDSRPHLHRRRLLQPCALPRSPLRHRLRTTSAALRVPCGRSAALRAVYCLRRRLRTLRRRLRTLRRAEYRPPPCAHLCQTKNSADKYKGPTSISLQSSMQKRKSEVGIGLRQLTVSANYPCMDQCYGLYAVYGAQQSTPCLKESRHLHAMRRARGVGGHFLNTKNVDDEKTATLKDE